MEYNSTMAYSSMSGVSNMSNWFSILSLVAIAAVLLGIMLYGLGDLKRFKRIEKILKMISKSLMYFGYGIGALVFLAIPTGAIYLLATETASGNTFPIKFIGYGIGGYAGISLLGYFVKKKIVDKWKEYTKKKGIKERIKNHNKGGQNKKWNKQK